MADRSGGVRRNSPIPSTTDGLAQSRPAHALPRSSGTGGGGNEALRERIGPRPMQNLLRGARLLRAPAQALPCP